MSDSNGSRFKATLAIEYLPIASLQLDARNPRQHSDRQLKQIARSVKTFGFNVPVLIDSNNKILAGHGRMCAAKLLGLQEVPAIRIEHLTAAQARAFAIADNRLTESSTWDDRLLGEIFTELAALDLDFSLEDTGFTMGEIGLRIEGLSVSAETGPDPADQLPQGTNQRPVSVLGDLWVLGRHRLLCGNALEKPAYETLMRDVLAQAVFTDPPYNVRISGHASGNGRTKHREFAMATGEMTSGQFAYFLTTILCLLKHHSTNGSLHYICMDWRHMGEVLAAGTQIYDAFLNLCVWVKDNGGMGSFYRSRHELIFVFRNGKGSHRNNVRLGQYGRNRTNVWEYPGINTLSKQGEEDNLLALHPTVKPVALIADAILDCTVRGDVVLDSFIGSGSTLIAAERVGRLCYGMEIDPVYVDTAICRWQKYTGKHAIHATTGKRFDECKLRVEVPHD